MKKIFFRVNITVLLCIFALFLFGTNLIFLSKNKAYVRSYSISRITYAKAKENCFLFKTSDVTDSSFNNVFFIVPETYFVSILSEVNTQIVKVQYNNKIGYVSSDSVSKVSFTPVTPVLNSVTFDIGEDSGTQLRRSPEAEDSSNVLKVIPAGSQDIIYIASIMGAIPTGGSSNIWYYAMYTPSSDPTSIYEGYIYSSKAENLSVIPLNDEVDSEYESEPNGGETKDGLHSINKTIKVVLIILICVPIVLVFILLVASNRRNKRAKDLEKQLEDDELPETIKSVKSDRPRIKKIKDLEGKSLEKKEGFYAKFITSSDSGSKAKSSSPIFPTYEVIDDEDLL